MVDDVGEFHRVFGQPIRDTPSVPAPERVQLRADLIAEEYVETLQALGFDATPRAPRISGANVDLVKLADGLTDLIYVAIGCALEFGIPLEAVWNEVHRTNMAKVDLASGTVRRRLDGKVLKPDGWTPPDIRAILGL